MHDPYRALYLHLPFCKQRCRYCDFTAKATDDADEMSSYVDELVLSIRRASKAGELGGIETIYLGGGTPSHIGAGNLSKLLYALSTSVNMVEGVECTMEANPESLTLPMIRDIWALGVNRLSIGVQSFDDALLATLGRVHDGSAAREAIALAHDRFDNVSVDLMCGIPGQTREGFIEDLRAATTLGVSHVSVYPLTIERGTMLDTMLLRGMVDDVDEDLQADMMEDASAFLSEKGYSRYEVASYARPGCECRHNIAYWTGKPYLGFGTSAVTMTQNGSRRMRKQDGTVTDDLDRAQMRAEDLMLGMRMACGVSVDRVADARDDLPAVDEAFRKLEAAGLVFCSEGRYRPTEKGWLCGNELYGELIDLAPWR